MGKLAIWMILAAMLPTLAAAQPPEEVPPPPPDATAPEQPATPATSAPVTIAPDNTAPIPVAEPAKAPEAPKAEDKTIKGITLSPAVGVYPIGFDSYNITDPEGSRYYFGLKPSIGAATAFKTATGKAIDFEFGYGMEWREYYNKAGDKRDFGHALSGSVSVPFTDRLTLTVPGEFDYFFKVGADDANDSTIAILALPKVTYTVNPELTLKTEYNLEYWNTLDAAVGSGDIDSFTDPVPDIDDLRDGNFGSVLPPSVDDPNAVSENLYESINHLVVGAVWKPIKGTKVGFDYRYTIKAYSNVDTREYHAHWFIPSISQDMPWPGGTVSLKDDLRLRIYDFKKSKLDSNATYQNFRNRITISATQAINDYMSFEAYFRLVHLGSNDDDYDKIDQFRHFYLGMNFTF